MSFEHWIFSFGFQGVEKTVESTCRNSTLWLPVCKKRPRINSETKRISLLTMNLIKSAAEKEEEGKKKKAEEAPPDMRAGRATLGLVRVNPVCRRQDIQTTT